MILGTAGDDKIGLSFDTLQQQLTETTTKSPQSWRYAFSHLTARVFPLFNQLVFERV